MTSTPSAIDVAHALLREGRVAEAEDVAVGEVRAATARHGAGSPQWASAQCDLGTVLFNAGQTDRAIGCYRAALSVAADDDPAARRDRLTYRTNLGTALWLAGRLEEAEAELRRGVRERLAYYGREHAAYAFGLEPLAEVLLARGNTGQARRVADEAVDNLWSNGHERVAPALALRAEVVLAGDGEPFARVDELPDELVEQVADAVMDRLGRGSPRERPLAAALAAMLRTRLGPDHPATRAARSALADL